MEYTIHCMILITDNIPSRDVICNNGTKKNRDNPMPKLFILDIETDATKYLAYFRLSDAKNNEQLAAHEITIGNDKAFQWEALFDTQEHIKRYANNLRPAKDAEPYTEAQLLQQTGVFLGKEVLGHDIIKALHDGVHQRTLLIRLPDTSTDPLAAAFARVPWEIARPDR
jgi:hypothetical protein